MYRLVKFMELLICAKEKEFCLRRLYKKPFTIHSRLNITKTETSGLRAGLANHGSHNEPSLDGVKMTAEEDLVSSLNNGRTRDYIYFTLPS